MEPRAVLGFSPPEAEFRFDLLHKALYAGDLAWEVEQHGSGKEVSYQKVHGSHVQQKWREWSKARTQAVKPEPSGVQLAAIGTFCTNLVLGVGVTFAIEAPVPSRPASQGKGRKSGLGIWGVGLADLCWIMARS